MFSKKITESDQFLDMSLSAQCLYFHINMAADDEGFVGNVKTIKRMIGASDDDLKILIGKEFLIPFKTGVVVIRDWKIHNYIQKDRYSSTFYSYEKAMLATTPNKQYQIKKENCIQSISKEDTECIQNVSKTDTEYPECIQSGYKVDTECIQSVSKVYPKRIQNIQQESENEGDNSLETASNKQCEDLYPNCIQNVSKTDTQVRLGKVSIELGKNSIELDKNSIDQLRSDKDIDKDINKDIDINKDKEPVDFELDEGIRTYAQICKRYPSEEDREKAFSKLLERGRDYLSGNWEPKSKEEKE